jgi:hypothetical protein
VIARSHFTRVADEQGVDAKTVERDYVLTHVLAAISQHPGCGSMSFKGGTALRPCHFEHYGPLAAHALAPKRKQDAVRCARPCEADCSACLESREVDGRQPGLGGVR